MNHLALLLLLFHSPNISQPLSCSQRPGGHGNNPAWWRASRGHPESPQRQAHLHVVGRPHLAHSVRRAKARHPSGGHAARSERRVRGRRRRPPRRHRRRGRRHRRARTHQHHHGRQERPDGRVAPSADRRRGRQPAQGTRRPPGHRSDGPLQIPVQVHGEHSLCPRYSGGLLIYISIDIQLTNPNSLNTQSTPIFSIPNDNNILLPFADVTNH